jgi:allophanate hydrolase subunit 2
VLAGPRADRLTPESVGRLDGARYVVGPDSNRVGLRLQGAALRWASREDELPSEGMVLGAVQVPPDGQPVVFLNDHPTTGGYPVVGVVRRADLPVCAQARPGDELVIRLSPVPEPRRG